MAVRQYLVKLLLDRDADIESKCNSSRTPLSWTIYYGHEAIVKRLLARSADESLDYYRRPDMALTSAMAENGRGQ
jgi:ankyrin repeat protein